VSRYALLGSGADLRAFVAYFGNSPPCDVVFVAACSAAMVACLKHKVPFVTIDEFSRRKDIIDLGWANYDRLDKFCLKWDKMAQKSTQALAARKIAPFRFSYYDLKILIDSISVKILMLQGLVNAAVGSSIFFVPERSRRMVVGESLRPCDNLNSFSILLEEFFAASANLHPVPAGLPRWSRHIGALKGWLRVPFNFVKTVLRELRRAVQHKGGKCFVLFNPGHDIRYLLPTLTERGYSPVCSPRFHARPKSDAIRECRQLWLSLERSATFHEVFSVAGFGYFKLLKPALQTYVEAALPSAVAAYDQMKKVLRRTEPTFGLTGTINLGLTERCRMLAAQHTGFPLITYMEGAGYGTIITPIYDRTEPFTGDALLCYGPGCVEYYRDLGVAGKPVYPVGSAHQQKIYQAVRSLETSGCVRTVMYVSTLLQDDVFHVPNNGLVATAYRKTQLEIFRFLCALPEHVRVVAKPQQIDRDAFEALALPEFGRLEVDTRRFEYALEGVDLVVIDFPSTVLLSAIGTTAQVVVLIEEGASGLTEKQRERLERRAWVFDSLVEMQGTVAAMIADGCRFPRKCDDSYMLSYSINSMELDAISDAIDTIERISKGHRHSLRVPRTQKL
jgi:hypothetical protein